MRSPNCLNCGSSLGITQQFCAVCGQKADTHRLNLHEIIHDALHHLTHADKGLFKLLRELALRPGVVAREYVAGKRVKYFKPVNFFLIVGGIMVFMTTYFQHSNESVLKQYEQDATNVKDPVKKQILYDETERKERIIHYMGKYSNMVNILATPLYAFILWLFYRKAGYSFIEHLVANMYIMSFVMLWFALLLVPWQKQLFFESSRSWIFLGAFMLFQTIYGATAYYQFINKKGAGPFLKALGIYLFAMLFWEIGASTLANLYVATGFR